MKGINFMYGYWGKVTGMIMTPIGIALLIAQKLAGLTIFTTLSSAQHFNLILAFILLGLTFITFSMEKNEDERIQQIRARSFMLAFGLLLSMGIAIATSFSIIPSTGKSEFANGITLSPEDMVMAARVGMAFLTLGFVIHILMFHVGLYFDQTWNYKEEAWTPRVLWKHKRYRIVILVVLFILIQLIFRFVE